MEWLKLSDVTVTLVESQEPNDNAINRANISLNCFILININFYTKENVKDLLFLVPHHFYF